MNVLFPTAHPRSALDLKNTRQQLIPLKWNSNGFAFGQRREGIRMRQTWQFPISPRADYLFPATNRWDRLIPIRSAGQPIGVSPLSDVSLGHQVEFVVSER